MATELFKLGGVAGAAGTFVVQDNAGNVEVLVDGTKVLDAQQSAIVSLTDSTGGTAGDTIANLADGTTYANDHAALENNLASLAAKIDEILVALRAHGIIAT